ncbi:MAG: hypothetical protein LKG17_04300 [Megasphaera sp.]|nr:hypothetical protein [Megasphaera sp.]
MVRPLMRHNGFLSLTEMMIAVSIAVLCMMIAVPCISWNRRQHDVDILTRQFALDLQDLRQHSLANGGIGDQWILRIGQDQYYVRQNYMRRKERLFPQGVVITPAGKEIRFNGTGKPEGTMSFVVSLQDKTYSRKVIVASQTGRIRLE